MADTIRVIIVDDLVETRENVRKLLQFEQDVEVIAQAGTGEDAILLAQEHQPDIILMDINMPGIDGIGASQKISESVPQAQIIIMSVQSDSDYLRRAMLAGARDFLTKPFSGDELIAAVRRVHAKRPARPTARTSSSQGGHSQTADYQDEQASLAQGNVIAVFSPKGGCGCTTTAINTAVSLAKQGHQTVLVDASLQFGDVAVMLNMKPITSLVDVSSRADELDTDLISTIVQTHRSGLNVLLAPPRPEMAEVVTEAHMKDLLEKLRQMYEYIIVDTTSSLNDIALTVLDVADRILLIAQQNLPSVRNVSRFISLTESLEYESEKVLMIITSYSEKHGISPKKISDALKRPVVMMIPEDFETVYEAANQGKPLVDGPAQKRPVSIAFNQLSKYLMQEFGDGDGTGVKIEESTESSSSGGMLGRLLGKR